MGLLLVIVGYKCRKPNAKPYYLVPYGRKWTCTYSTVGKPSSLRLYQVPEKKGSVTLHRKTELGSDTVKY